tara:strand:+ start:141 stop:425 length:285 start_codon:yes stop_codon:yes gene_type:complete
MKKLKNGILVDMTSAEVTEWNSLQETPKSEFDMAMEDLRAKRNRLIAETDYLALSDQTLSTEMATYRTNLRNITNGLTTVDDIENLTWPTKPSE